MSNFFIVTVFIGFGAWIYYGYHERRAKARAEEFRLAILAAELKIRNMLARRKIEERLSDKDFSYHRTGLDILWILSENSFSSKVQYLHTILHEAIHWTGEYLGRPQYDFSRDRYASGRNVRGYALEELVAEIGAWMLCQHFGLPASVKASQNYMNGYLYRRRNQTKMLTEAQIHADAAVKLLLLYP